MMTERNAFLVSLLRHSANIAQSPEFSSVHVEALALACSHEARNLGLPAYGAAVPACIQIGTVHLPHEAARPFTPRATERIRTRRPISSNILKCFTTAIVVIRRSALFRRSSSFGIGPKLSRPRMRLHKPGPLEGEKPREAHGASQEVLQRPGSQLYYSKPPFMG